MIDYFSSKGEPVFDFVMFIYFCCIAIALLYGIYSLIHQFLKRTAMTDRSKRIVSVTATLIYLLGACFTHSWVYARYGCVDKTQVESTGNCIVAVQGDAIRNAIIWPIYWTSEATYQIVKLSVDTVR